MFYSVFIEVAFVFQDVHAGEYEKQTENKMLAFD